VGAALKTKWKDPRRQEFLLALAEPLFASVGLALGAVLINPKLARELVRCPLSAPVV
jgi:hypothetical protein